VSKILGTLIKLYELANRGTGGERINAKAMLEILLNKHGITFEELQDNIQQPEEFIFSYGTQQEKALLFQIIYKVNGNARFRQGNKKIWILLVKNKYAEILTLYTIYRSALKKELKLTFRAFVQSQNIFPETKPEDEEPTDDRENTEEELEIIRRAKIMPVYEVNKLLEVSK
jgi:hypothetical protein